MDTPLSNFKEYMERKECTQCKEDRSQAEFIKVVSGRHNMCDPCRLAYHREYNQKRASVDKRLW